MTLNWNDTSGWPPAYPTHGAYPACAHPLIARGRDESLIHSDYGERCPNCGAYVVFKCAPEKEPAGTELNPINAGRT